MAGVQNSALTTIIKRLEAATSRLEDLAIASASSANLRQPSPDAADSVGARVAQEPSIAPSAPTPAPSLGPTITSEDSPVVKAFDVWFDDHLQPYLKLSETIGDVAFEQSKTVALLFKAQRDFIELASQCTKPSQDKLPSLLGPMVTHLTSVGDIKDANRGSPQFNHLSTVAEGIPSAGWITLDNKPGPYVGDLKDAANFYGNRVIKEYKESDKTQVEWVRSFINALEELRKYIMQYHTTGLAWNPKGKDPLSFSPSAPTPISSAASSSPAPVGTTSTPSPASGPSKGLFAELSGDVTKGLKKVDKSEMTHKNPELRASSVVPATDAAPKRPTRPTKPPSLAGKKPAKFELEGNKWAIEYQENNNNIILEDVEIKQIVSIYGCKNSVIQVKGKVNAISLTACSKTSVLLDSVVSSVSVTSSPSFTIQVLGRTPTVTIDTTDSGQVYLSKECIDGATEIITSKCSAINVSIPDPETDEEGLFVERAVPEQLKTVVKDGKLITTIVEHSG
ncbi:Adenylate cyclase-associated protein (CAP/Srv2p) [Phaffia rhodozyma]|uniref:Adenylyl cyclase-associated protein n=1 Tax=Phaffia rhodozyma TaxID=264483 RepID=A0A0F7ST07_PHARH|nr:Adenylate cyclase-associated protein (CAP/Srv2p) [Phaffia rhodozyma]